MTLDPKLPDVKPSVRGAGPEVPGRLPAPDGRDRDGAGAAAPAAAPPPLAREPPRQLPWPNPPPPRCPPAPGKQSAGAAAWSGDLLVLGVFEGALETSGEGEGAVTVIASPELQALDEALGGAVADVVATYDFKGKPVRPPGARCCCGAVDVLPLPLWRAAVACCC